MSFGLFEILLIVIIFQLLVFTGFLVSKRHSRISNSILALFLLAQALLILNRLLFSNPFFFNNFTHFLLAGYPFCLIWGPTFYLYVKSIEDPHFKIEWKHTLHFIPFIAEATILFLTFYLENAETKRTITTSPSLFLNNNFKFVNFFLIIQILGYNIKSLHILYTYRKKLKNSLSSFSKTNLSWLNFFIIGYTIAHLASVSIKLSSITSGERGLYLRIILFLIFLIFFNIIFFKGWQQPEIFTGLEETVKYKASRLSKQESISWIKKLNEYISINKPYLNPGISIKQLADGLNISPRFLSQVINENFSQNFYDYINSLRIEESKKMLSDSSEKKTILEILYQAGFNSKTAFNIAFKKATGLTPTEFRKKAAEELFQS